MDVIALVIVAALVIGNDIVAVIDAVDDLENSFPATFTFPATSTVSFPRTSAATITASNRSTMPITTD